MKRQLQYQPFDANESALFSISLKMKVVGFLKHRIYLIYFFAVSLAVLLTSFLYTYTVLPIPESSSYTGLVPRFPYAYRQRLERVTIYPDFDGYEFFSCRELRYSTYKISNEITLRFSEYYRNFSFTLTRGQRLNLSLVSPVNQTDLRGLFVVYMGDSFIGDTTGLVCSEDVCAFSLTSVEKQKHDVVLQATTFNIDTENCEQLFPYQVRHIFGPKNDDGSYYFGGVKDNYIVMTMLREQTIWGMESGNALGLYRMVRNDPGINALTLALCFISIIAVVGGVSHVSLRAAEESEN